MNIPGARSPTLLPNCFCQARYEIFSVMMVVPTATISWTSRPWRLLRCAASFRSRVALRRRVARYRWLCFHVRRSLPCFLMRPALIVVVRVVGAALPVHLTLQLAYRLDIGGQFGAEDLQAWGALKRHNSNRGGSQVQPNRVVADRVFGLVIRHASERQLHPVALALFVSPLCVRTARLAHQEAGIFDGVAQAVDHHRIFPVDQSRQSVVLPQQVPGIAFLGWLEHEAQPGVVALVLHTGETPASTLKTHPSRLTQTHSVEGAIGPRANVWASTASTCSAIQVQFNPLAASCRSYSENPYCCRSAPKARLRSSFWIRGIARAALPGGGGPHAAQSSLSFGQDRVIQVPRGFEVGTQPLRLPRCDRERQFQEKGRCWFARVRVLLCTGALLPGHRLESSLA